MNVLLGALGLLLVATVLLDVVRTTLSVRGSGWVSGRLAEGLWSAALALHRRRASHGVLSMMGTVILVAIIAMWTGALWLGWSLCFLFDPAAVVVAGAGTPATTWETFYFVGYSMITLGNGEYRPDGVPWQAATLLATATGFFVITLAITFLLSVLPAVVAKRRISSTIASLGLRPETILIERWHGGDCRSLTRHLDSLNDALGAVAQQHLAYPILHYFHSVDPHTALPLRLAALHEALTLLRHGLRSCRDTAREVRPLYRTIVWYLEMLEHAFFDAHDQAPEATPLARLEGHGLELAPESEYRAAVDGESDCRRLLHGYLHKDGWVWGDVFGDP